MKVLLALLGVVGLHMLLRDFGYARIFDDISRLGFDFVWVVLCFLFPFTLLTFAWRVLLTEKSLSSPYLFLVSLVANAWNNIGPVSKSLGEPTRVLLLSEVMPVRQAVRGMFLFNITQAMGTAATFGLGACFAPLLFDLTDGAFIVTVASALVALTINGLATYWVLSGPGGRKRPTRGQRLRALNHWLRWISHQIRRYAQRQPKRFFASVALTAAARLSEGLVFYAIFLSLGSPLTLVESVAVDIGRGIADNAFFFVPYQLGTREYSLVFMTESVIRRGAEAAIAASLVFRLGEIFWIFLGFLVGLSMIRAPRK